MLKQTAGGEELRGSGSAMVLFGAANVLVKSWDWFSRDTPTSISRLSEETKTEISRICALPGSRARFQSGQSQVDTYLLSGMLVSLRLQ